MEYGLNGGQSALKRGCRGMASSAARVRSTATRVGWHPGIISPCIHKDCGDFFLGIQSLVGSEFRGVCPWGLLIGSFSGVLQWGLLVGSAIAGPLFYIKKRKR